MILCFCWKPILCEENDLRKPDLGKRDLKVKRDTDGDDREINEYGIRYRGRGWKALQRLGKQTRRNVRGLSIKRSRAGDPIVSAAGLSASDVTAGGSPEISGLNHAAPISTGQKD